MLIEGVAAEGKGQSIIALPRDPEAASAAADHVVITILTWRDCLEAVDFALTNLGKLVRTDGCLAGR